MVEIYGGNVVLQIIVLPSTVLRADSGKACTGPGSDRSGLEMVRQINSILKFRGFPTKGLS